MGDFSFRFKNSAQIFADLEISRGDFLVGNELETAVIMSLFSDSRAEDDEYIRYSSNFQRPPLNRGFWVDTYRNTVMGSGLWLLEREKRLQSTLVQAETYASDCLQWLIRDGVCKSINVTAEFDATNQEVLNLDVVLTRQDEETTTLQYAYVWDTINTAAAQPAASAPPATPDPNTVLLLPMQGANGATNFFDASLGGVGSPHTVTAVADAQISTGQTSPFGDSDGVGLLDGTGDYLSVPASADWDYGSDNFTVEFWFRADASQVNSPHLLSSSSFKLRISLDNKTDVGRNDGALALVAIGSTSTSAATYDENNGTLYLDQTWHHLALCRVTNTMYLFIDGIRLTPTYGTETIGGTLDESAETVYVGTYNGSDTFNGYLSDLRISNGIARYTANFTPPTAHLNPYL